MELGIKGRLALVTGASDGIGREIALALADEGARLVLSARRPDKLQDVVERCGERGADAVAIPCDLSVAASRETLIARTNEIGPVDLFMGNTGGPGHAAASEATASDWQSASESLLYSMTHLTNALLPAMRARRYGRIVYITSVAVKQPIANLALSNGIRAAVTGYARTLANEVASSGVTVNCVAPGFTKTARLEDMATNRSKAAGITSDEWYRQIASTIPAARLGTPREIANVSVFLMSAAASYVTGQTIAVDGGSTKRMF
jgi:3-oxoacyl-[acyl-carrier protein] reductase